MSSYYSQYGFSRAVNAPNSYGSLYSSYLRPPKVGGGYIGSNPALGGILAGQGPLNSQPGNTPGQSAPSPPPAAAPTGGGGGAPNIGNVDFSNDPILQKIQALANQQISDATAEAIRQRTQLAIGYGDPALVDQLDLGGKTGQQGRVFRTGRDTSVGGKYSRVAEEAKNNPFSTVAELARAYSRRNVFDVNRPLSDSANLFYSSERGRQLALSGEQNLRDRAQAGNAVQQKIADISNQLLQAKLQAQQQVLQGEMDAYNRALQLAMYSAGVSG